MAIIKQGILGGIQNKVGNVVGTSWKGIAVLKSMPISVANPRTAAQVTQRQRFANIVRFSKAILAEVIKPLWDRFAQKQSGYNAFVQTNIVNFNSFGIETPTDLVISKGRMSSTAIDTAALNSTASTATITWTNDSGQDFKQNTDTAYVVICESDGAKVAGFDTGIKRDEETLTVSYESRPGTQYFVYLAFKRMDGTIVSNTSFFAVIAT